MRAGVINFGKYVPLSCARNRRKNWCGRWESNPHEEKSPEDFHAVYGFRRPEAALGERSCPVCGLDYPFTVSRKIRGLGAARLVSTPSRLDSFAGLGSGLPLQVSPNLSSSASPVSRRALKFRLSPQRLPFRHARMGGYCTLSYKLRNGIYTSVSGGVGRCRFCVLVCVPGWSLIIFFGFGRMMLIAVASRLVLICDA